MRGKMFIYIAIFAFAVLSANTILANLGMRKLLKMHHLLVTEESQPL